MTAKRRLTELLADMGVPVEIVHPDEIAGNLGLTTFLLDGTPLMVQIAAGAQIGTWLHETAHVLLDHGRRYPAGSHYSSEDYNADAAETEAEAVAQVVAGSAPDPRFTGTINPDYVIPVIQLLQEVLDMQGAAC
jgi:hypothetical protein